MPITIKRVAGLPVMLQAETTISMNFQYTKTDLIKRVVALTKQLQTAPPDNPPTFIIEGLSKEQVEQIREALWFRGYNDDEPLSNQIANAYSESLK